MEILRPLANLSRELTLEAGKGLYQEVIAPELALTSQQQEAARKRSRFNQQDLIAELQIEMEEQLLQTQVQYPGRMVSRLFDVDPQIRSDVTRLGDVRSQLAQYTQPIFHEANTTALGTELNAAPVYTPPTVATMDAGYV